jgi:phosphomethylpyrimidine synthase
MPATLRGTSPDDDLSRARAALNWSKQFELAFDGDRARALHDEDLDVDTDFCAMCGHDWCSVRISKEIVEFASGKAETFQPARPSMSSPGLSAEQQGILRSRGVKHACHSDAVPDAETARQVQQEYVKLNVPR